MVIVHGSSKNPKKRTRGLPMPKILGQLVETHIFFLGLMIIIFAPVRLSSPNNRFKEIIIAPAMKAFSHNTLYKGNQ